MLGRGSKTQLPVGPAIAREIAAPARDGVFPSGENYLRYATLCYRTGLVLADSAYVHTHTRTHTHGGGGVAVSTLSTLRWAGLSCDAGGLDASSAFLTLSSAYEGLIGGNPAGRKTCTGSGSSPSPGERRGFGRSATEGSEVGGNEGVSAGAAGKGLKGAKRWDRKVLV